MDFKVNLKEVINIKDLSNVNVKRLRKIWPNILPYLFILIIAIVVFLPQIMNHSLFIDGDFAFHANQIYESAMQIKTGHFSWFLSIFGFNRTGRIINAVYGPIFTYLMGELLLLLKNWFNFQLFTEISVTAIAGSFMYHLGRFCDFDRAISLFLGILYMSSFPVSVFINESAYTGLGAVIVPFAGIVGIKMWRTHQIPIFQLVALIVISSQIHVLTTITLIVVLVPFSLLSLIGSHHKLVWLKKMILSVMLVILLTGDVWGSILEVNSYNNIILPFPNYKMATPRSAIDLSSWPPSIINNIMVLIIGITIILAIINYRYFDHFQFVYLILAGIFFWISSVYFPWQRLICDFPPITQTIQQPYRFTEVFITFILLALGYEIEQTVKFHNFNLLSKAIFIGIMILLAVFSTYTIFTQNEYNAQAWDKPSTVRAGMHRKINPTNMRKSSISSNLSRVIYIYIAPNPDYLPSNQKINYSNYYKVNPYKLNDKQLIQIKPKRYRVPSTKEITTIASPNHNQLRFRRIFNRENNLTLKWYQPKLRANKWVLVPVVKYHQTKLKLNHHRIRHLKISSIGAVYLHPKPGMNYLTLQYFTSLWFKLVIVITILSWIFIITMILLNKLI